MKLRHYFVAIGLLFAPLIFCKHQGIDPTEPPAPDESFFLTVTDFTARNINLEWDDLAGKPTYSILRAKDATNPRPVSSPTYLHKPKKGR